jgi:arylsulfatase A-like enzyme/predicted Zn-dependent protease
MNKKRILIIGLPAVVIIIALLLFLLLPKDEFSRLKGKKDYNYILISVDTLRADRIGCYGFSGIETPSIDLFAERGVRFERCIAQTPLTLPSHTSLLTGTPPTFHGVRDNGGFLVPQQLVTLAELFKEQDYQTAAFVAAYVLDSKWGLNQGFDFYFDRFDLSKYKTISLGNVQRRGDEVIDETIHWLDQNSKHKFFTWVHLYDPHTPYDPPSPFKDKYPNRHYLGEIAYTDNQLGRLWRYLEENDLLSNTILVFVSDHGESLGEHKESTHGFFIYQEGIHVPLIFVTPFEKLHGIVRTSVVSLVDVMPTILEMADVPIPTHVQGHSLLPFFMGEEELKSNFAYSETFYPRFHYGWSELTSVQDERFKLIIAPRLELYDLRDDPEERNNLLATLPEEARRLKNLADDFIERSSQNALQLDYSHIDEEARQKLTALGYIGTFTDVSSLKEKRPGDPKDKIVVFNQLSEARELGLKGNFEQAERLVEQIIQDDPDVIDAYFTLGNLYFKEGKFEKALESFFKALEKKPDDAFTAINIANSYISMGDFNEAETFLLDIIEALPPDSQIHFILGNINYFQKEYEEALKNYEKCLELNPSSASAYNGIGGIYVIQGNLDEAENYLEKAKDLNPQLRNLHYNLAQLYEEKDDLQQAIKEYQAELENIPHNFRACFNLSRIYRILGQTEDEQKYLEKTKEINPNFSLSYFYLARIYLNQGKNYDEAISLAKKGIELKPEEKDLPLGYFLLADLYNRIGDSAKSSEYARKGKELVRSNSEK